jgi:hypothetical protein
MSAKLMKAFADGRLVVMNRKSGSVQVHTSEGIVIVPPQVQIDLTRRKSLAALRQSPNLRGLVNSRMLEVV